MTAPASKVTYQLPDGESIEIRRYDASDVPLGRVAMRYAGDSLDLMRDAYLQIARRAGIITEAAVTAHFSEMRVHDQAQRMARYMHTNNSRYYFAHRLGGTNPIGMAKVSPSRPGIKKLIGKPNAFFNDVAVREEGRGIGSALMYTSLDPSVFSEKGPVNLNAHKGNERANQWFKELGFVIKNDVQIEPITIGPEQVEEVRMEAATLADVRQALEDHHPWLAINTQTA